MPAGGRLRRLEPKGRRVGGVQAYHLDHARLTVRPRGAHVEDILGERHRTSEGFTRHTVPLKGEGQLEVVSSPGEHESGARTVRTATHRSDAATAAPNRSPTSPAGEGTAAISSQLPSPATEKTFKMPGRFGGMGKKANSPGLPAKTRSSTMATEAPKPASALGSVRTVDRSVAIAVPPVRASTMPAAAAAGRERTRERTRERAGRLMWGIPGGEVGAQVPGSLRRWVRQDPH